MSYPPQGYPPPGYGGYPQGGYQQEHPKGTTVLVLGILGLVLCQLCAPFAWSMGNKTLKEIDANPGRYSNRGTVNAGRICGIVGSVLLIFWLLYVIFVIVLVIGSASTST